MYAIVEHSFQTNIVVASPACLLPTAHKANMGSCYVELIGCQSAQELSRVLRVDVDTPFVHNSAIGSWKRDGDAIA